MPLSGAWLRSTTYLQPMYQRVPPPDPRHAEPGQENPYPPIWEAPTYAPGGDQLRLYERPMAGQPGEADRTPVDPEQNRGAWRQGLDEAQLAVFHERDLGAVERGTTINPRLVGSDDYDTVVYTQFPGPLPGTDLWARRGINAYPENNPVKAMYAPGLWREARDTRQFVDHNLAQPMRVHRFHAVGPNVANVATNRPPPPDHGPYNPPFPSLARSIRERFAKPRMRREPGTLTEAVQLDDTTPPAAGLSAAYSNLASL